MGNAMWVSYLWPESRPILPLSCACSVPILYLSYAFLMSVLCPSKAYAMPLICQLPAGQDGGVVLLGYLGIVP